MKHDTSYCVQKRACRRRACVERTRAMRRGWQRACRERNGVAAHPLGLINVSIAATVVDVLEAYRGEWFMLDGLLEEVGRFRPVGRESLRRTMFRLVARGSVERRDTAGGKGRFRLSDFTPI